jgi:hypothetical protein
MADANEGYVGRGRGASRPGNDATLKLLSQVGPVPGGEGETWLPELVPVRQVFDCNALKDVPAAVRRALGPLRPKLQPGMTVAVTAGSRGVHDMVAVLREAGGFLREAGASPFVVPAMGSHGGGTAEGQISVLAHLGVSEASVNMPIRATMATVEIGKVPGGPPIFLDANAAAADAILAVNRVKPHTDFHGPIESGLAKMLAIGLGKTKGAESIHAYGPSGLTRFIPEIARQLEASGRVIGGLAIVENALDRTERIELLWPEEIGSDRETQLLEDSARLMGRLPFENLDVLVIDEMGKNYSGVGMDPNVIGRARIEGTLEPSTPSINVVAVLGLAAASGGNACGVGLADITTQRLVSAIDLGTTYVNVLTSGLGGIRRGQIPIVMPSDREAVLAAVRGCGRPAGQARRIARIHDTLNVSELLVSQVVLEEIGDGGRVKVVGDAAPMTFDAGGNVTPWPSFPR